MKIVQSAAESKGLSSIPLIEIVHIVWQCMERLDF